MSYVTLGDAAYNSGLGWLIHVRAEYDLANNEVRQGKFPCILQSLKQADMFEWTVSPFGFEYRPGWSDKVEMSVRILSPTLEQRTDLAIASIVQWGCWAHYDIHKKNAWPKEIAEHPKFMAFAKKLKPR